VGLDLLGYNSTHNGGGFAIFLLHFLCLRSLGEIVDPVKTRVSVSHTLTLRRLMSYIYIYGAPILDVSRSHTTTHHSQ